MPTGAENSATQVEIADCDPTLMRLLLRFIYAEEVAVPEEVADALELLWCVMQRRLKRAKSELCRG